MRENADFIELFDSLIFRSIARAVVRVVVACDVVCDRESTQKEMGSALAYTVR